MKQKFYQMALLCAIILVASCTKDADVLAPVVSGTEVDTVLNVGDKLLLAPDITNLVGVGYTWLVNDKEVGSGETHYTFTATEPGSFIVVFRAGNKGGTGEKIFKILVEKPIVVNLKDAESLSVPMCQVLDIVPQIDGPERSDYQYEWAIGDSIIGNKETLEFIAVTPGEYTLTLTAKAGKQSEAAECKVLVKEAEYSAYVSSLLEYQPSLANGSPIYWLMPFANSTEEFNYPYDKYIQTLSERIAQKPSLDLGLGWWGGYAVYGFDHTVPNITGKSDIQLYIHSHYPNETAVFVAYDKNKNGLPDNDEWFEIRANYYGNETIKDYELAYAVEILDRDNGNKDVIIKWNDNQGGEENIAKYEDQPAESITWALPGGYYKDGAVGTYDGWKNSYTLKGKMINVQLSGAMESRNTLTVNIDDAVDSEGNKVHLPGIDFIKVQNITIAYFQQGKTPMESINKRVSTIKDIHL